MKTTNMISKEYLEKYACRLMTYQELKTLHIEDNNTYEYYVCEDWLKFLLNFITIKDFEIEIKHAIDVSFETKVAEKQRQSIKQYKKPKLLFNQDYGAVPDIQSTLVSGMAKYQLTTKQKSFKKALVRNINPVCSWSNRFRAEDKIYALLSTQQDFTKVFINYIFVNADCVPSGRNTIIWFPALSFDMFKAKRHNFYPIVSHNLTRASVRFSNELPATAEANSHVSSFGGLEMLNGLL